MVYPNYSKEIKHITYGENLSLVKHVEYCYVLTNDADYIQHPDTDIITPDFYFVTQETLKRYDIYWLGTYYRITYVRDLVAF